MTNKAHYISEGTIRELMIWDTVSYKLASDSSLEQYKEVAPVYKRNRQLIDDFSDKIENVRLYIFFRAGLRGKKPSKSSTTVDNVTFVPVNYLQSGALSGAFVPTQWVQDVLIISGPTTVHYDAARMNTGFLKALENIFGKTYKFICFKDQEAGGNIQRFLTAEGDGMITGRRKSAPKKIPVVIPKQINLGSLALELYNNQTFHLDYYFHWLGCRSTFFSEDKALAEVHYCLRGVAYRESRFSGKPVKALGLNLVIGTAMQELRLRLLPDLLHEIEVPVMLIPHNQSDKRKEYYSLSYANCHVERIDSAGSSVKFRIYFPDFKDQLLQLVTEAALQNRKDDLREIGAVLYYTQTLFIPGVTLKSKSDELIAANPLVNHKRSIDNFVEVMEAKLKAAFNNYPVEVFFIKSRFRYLAQRFGSLHCMSKVMLRE